LHFIYHYGTEDATSAKGLQYSSLLPQLLVRRLGSGSFNLFLIWLEIQELLAVFLRK